ANATGVMEFVEYGEEELSSLAQTYEEQPALTDFEFDWSAIPEAPGAADETPVPTRAAAADETPVPTQIAAAETPLPALTLPPFPDFGIEGIEDEAVLWTNANADALQKGAQTYYVVFELERDSTVFSITTDHSLGGGAEPGQIALFSESGEQWGPFQAVGKAGQSGAHNAFWVADVGELALPAGRYAVTDSDPGSWSSNAASGSFGIAEVRGYAPAPAPAPTAQANPFGEYITPQTEKPAGQASFVGLWLSERMESGESLLLNVLSGDSLEQCYAYYMGDGYGGVESLTDANWNCLEFLTCSYVKSGDTLLIRSDRGMDLEYDFKVRDADTVVLTDEWGATFVMRRASQAQADSWRSWDWSGENTYDGDYGQYSNWMGGVSPEETLPGLWLSEPLGDGWQMLIYIIPDFWAEVYFGFYWGDGGNGVESLADPSWTFDESALYNYYVVSEEITFYEGYDSSSTFWFNMPDPNTIELVSDSGSAYYLHRATFDQENSWLGWMRNRAGN
ncbi:MAG: hypothetical protein GX592_12245, partial [Clostridiales bacterium]|nr:hypothetical protein [Clostridiales bacterium]